MAARKIIHVDMDAFYASVEQRDRPELKGRPVVVGGPPESRGVVASCSYEARRYGVRSAISSRQAFRLCPSAVFVPPDFKRYKEASRKIREIFLDVTDQVEPLSLDEAYLDVTTNKLNEPSATKLAQQIRDRIRSELSLTASAGVGPNKFIAKVASDLKKPDGMVVIPPDRVLAFVETLPVERLWGVGPATAKKLHAQGLRTAGEIRVVPVLQMELWFGRFGRFLHDLSFGRDEREVNSNREPKSRGAETTFEADILALAPLKQTIAELAEEVAQSLQKIQRPARTVVLKLRYADFSTITRSRTLSKATDRAETLASVATLLLEATDAGRRPVRLVGVSAGNLYDPNEPQQLWLDLTP